MSKRIMTCDLCRIPIFDVREGVPFRMTATGPADATSGDPAPRCLCIDCAAYFVVVAKGATGSHWLRRAIDGLFPRDEPPAEEGAAGEGAVVDQIASVVDVYSSDVDAERVEITIRTTVGEARTFVRWAVRGGA